MRCTSSSLKVKPWAGVTGSPIPLFRWFAGGPGRCACACYAYRTESPGLGPGLPYGCMRQAPLGWFVGYAPWPRGALAHGNGAKAPPPPRAPPRALAIGNGTGAGPPLGTVHVGSSWCQRGLLLQLGLVSKAPPLGAKGASPWCHPTAECTTYLL